MLQPTDESFPPGMPVIEVPMYIALNKAKAISEKLDADQLKLPILAADTVVVLC